MGSFISDRKLTEIDAAKERIDSRRIEDYVGLMHSGVMADVAENTSKLDPDNAKRGREIVNNFRKAWEYGINNFNGSVDKGLLQDLAGRLEPGMCNEGKLHAPVRIGGALPMVIGTSRYLPPSDSGRIAEAMQRMFEVVDMHHFHPVEEAFFYNLHLTRIQIFDNANKRLSNIVMNLILNKNGYFPVSINPSDKVKYKDLVGRSIIGFQNIASDEDNHLAPYLLPDRSQRDYHDFLADRELYELRTAEDSLKGLPSYIIEFGNVREKGILFSAKKKVANWFNAQNVPYQIKLKSNDHKMEVIGRIPQQILSDNLTRISGKLKFRIRLNGNH